VFIFRSWSQGQTLRRSWSTWRCTTLPCRRLAWSTNTPFYHCQPPRGTARQTVNSRLPAEPLKLRLHTSGIHCQLTSLWQARCPPVKTFLIQAVISWIIYWHHPASGRAVVAPLRPLWKFTDWLIDWLVLISFERCWHQFQLPNCIYKFHEQSFILSSLFDFWNNFFLDWFVFILSTATYSDFILCTATYRHALQLEMHLRLICVIKFYLLT